MNPQWLSFSHIFLINHTASCSGIQNTSKQRTEISTSECTFYLQLCYNVQKQITLWQWQKNKRLQSWTNICGKSYSRKKAIEITKHSHLPEWYNKRTMPDKFWVGSTIILESTYNMFANKRLRRSVNTRKEHERLKAKLGKHEMMEI